MPETNRSPKQHINPEHFPDNRPEQTAKTEQRAQNFSFATSYPYAPGRSSNSNNNNNNYHNYNNNSNYPVYNVQRYQSPYNFQHVVTNAFSVLHNSVELDYEQSSYNNKPNQAIVRPIIRGQTTEHVDQPAVAAAGNVSSNPPLTTRSFFSRSTQEVRSFADELSQKLRFLAPEENYAAGASSRSSAGTGAWLATRQMERPRFETTVPTGIFLPPPHELQMLPASMLRRHVYAYSSYPMILHSYYNANNNNNNNNNSQNKDTSRQISLADKENKASTRQNGVRATAAVAAAAAAASASKPDTQTLAGGLHITKAQFQQQLQQRRNNGDKR